MHLCLVLMIMISFGFSLFAECLLTSTAFFLVLLENGDLSNLEQRAIKIAVADRMQG